MDVMAYVNNVCKSLNLSDLVAEARVREVPEERCCVLTTVLKGQDGEMVWIVKHDKYRKKYSYRTDIVDEVAAKCGPLTENEKTHVSNLGFEVGVQAMPAHGARQILARISHWRSAVAESAHAVWADRDARAPIEAWGAALERAGGKPLAHSDEYSYSIQSGGECVYVRLSSGGKWCIDGVRRSYPSWFMVAVAAMLHKTSEAAENV